MGAQGQLLPGAALSFPQLLAPLAQDGHQAPRLAHLPLVAYQALPLLAGQREPSHPLRRIGKTNQELRGRFVEEDSRWS